MPDMRSKAAQTSGDTPDQGNVVTISLAEARSELSGLVRRAQGGQEAIITLYGKPVARIVPLEEDAAPLAVNT